MHEMQGMQEWPKIREMQSREKWSKKFTGQIEDPPAKNHRAKLKGAPSTA